MSRWYRIIGIPLPEVETLMKESSLKQVMGRMEETALSLEDEIKQKTMLLNKMNDIHKELRELESSLYTSKLKQLPGMYRLKQTDKNALLKNDIVKSLVINHYATAGDVVGKLLLTEKIEGQNRSYLEVNIPIQK